MSKIPVYSLLYAEICRFNAEYRKKYNTEPPLSDFDAYLWVIGLFLGVPILPTIKESERDRMIELLSKNDVKTPY